MAKDRSGKRGGSASDDGGTEETRQRRGKSPRLVPAVLRTERLCGMPSADGAFPIENAPFKIDTLLFVGSVKSLRRRLKSDGVDTEGMDSVDFSAMDGVTIPLRRPDGSRFVLVYLPKFDWSPSHFAVLSHEAVHAAVFVLRMSGVRNSILDGGETEEDSDDECLAHLVDSQVCAMVDALVRRGAKRFGSDV